jgi:hypothetical protein
VEGTKMKTPKEFLIDARNRIANPENWTKGTGARDDQGMRVPIAMGTRFCAMGSLWRCELGDTNHSERLLNGGNYSQELLDAADLLYEANGGSVPKFNDHPDTTHADILNLYDKAIALAEKEAKASAEKE